jgi:plastocyanin
MHSKLLPGLSLLILPLFVAAVGAGEVSVVATDQKGLRVDELVIWLEPLDAPVPPARPEELHATVEQIEEEFDPYTIAVRVGSKVQFPNRDAVQHHVYSLSKPAQFEIPLHGGEETESVVLDQLGLVPVGCNIHDWMLSYVMVVDTPWFGTTDDAGTLQIGELPAGRYQLKAWHPRLRKATEREIIVADTEVTELSLELKLRPDRRLRRAPTSGGATY